MSDDQDKIAQETEDILNKVLRDELEPAERIRQKSGKRRWFGLGLIALAPFCIVVGLVPWPTAGQTDRFMWLFYSLVLLLVGAWQIDRASKEDEHAAHVHDNGAPQSPESAQSKSIRVVR